MVLNDTLDNWQPTQADTNKEGYNHATNNDLFSFPSLKHARHDTIRIRYTAYMSIKNNYPGSNNYKNEGPCTMGLKRNHTSTVKMVALLLNADERDDIRAAIITAIIKPTNPIGSTFRTSLQKIKHKN